MNALSAWLASITARLEKSPKGQYERNLQFCDYESDLKLAVEVIAMLSEALVNARDVIYRAHENSDSYIHKKQFLKDYRGANDVLGKVDALLAASRKGE